MTGSITYSSATNTITCTGGTALAPITFADILAANDANNWGVVDQEATNQYVFSCKIIIGDASTATYFTDTNKQIIINPSVITANTQIFITSTTNAHVTLGAVQDVNSKSTSGGCHIYSKVTAYYYYWISDNGALGSRDTNVYGGSLNSDPCTDKAQTRAQRVWNFQTQSQGTSNIVCLPNGDYFNINALNTYYGIMGSSSQNLNKVTMLSGRAPLRIYGNVVDAAFKNIYCRHTSYIFQIDEATTAGLKCYAINVDSDTWAFWWVNSSGMTVYRQHELDLTVRDEAGNAVATATVVLLDKDGNSIFSISTDANGKIATQTVSYGYYTQAGGDTPTLYSPFTLKVYKQGYRAYYDKALVLDHKTALENVCLKRAW